MAASTTLMTAEQLCDMGPDAHFELIRGELRAMSPGKLPHGLVIGNLTGFLAHYVRINKLGGVIGAETGFILERNPDTVLAPDVAFIRMDRMAALLESPSFAEGAPDLVAEVRSPSNSVRFLEKKAADWLSLGAKLVWVADPAKRTVKVFRQGRDVLTLAGDDVLDGEDVVPGFQIRISEIFYS